jgi:hypothetical protein
MTLKSKTQNFQLEQALRVVLKNVDMKNREIIFTIAVEQGKEEVR